MLWFSSKHDQTGHSKKTVTKDQICTAVSEAWKLADEIGEMGAEQTGAGWGISERACHIEDKTIANEIGDIGAQQTAMGMDFSEYACKLEKQLKIIAKAQGCKLTPRPYN